MGLHQKNLTRQSSSGLAVFDLDCVESVAAQREILKNLKNKVERINSFPDVLEKAVGAIHAFPALFSKREKIETKHLKIYFGITQKTQLINRFKNHRKRHYILVLGKSSSAQARRFESGAIRIVKALEYMSVLCCAELLNIKERSRALGSESVIYLAINIDRKCVDFGNIQDQNQFDDALGYINVDLNKKSKLIERSDLRNFLKMVKGRKHETKLFWARESR
jgi:hypothetical protein